ncbi:MAG TPA: lytic transglycosylase domain-containing protein [Sphingobium sp.]|nr:lytic transglycosylase domain-containing protein [Sphingobium sp.]
MIERAAPDQAIQATIAEWRRLQQSDMLGFSAYANFLVANPGWPGEDHLRAVAERSVNPNSYDPGQTIAFFTRFPPRTATGQARFAFALAASGRMDEARVAARRAWTEGVLSPDDEQRILSLFYTSLTSEEHLRHADVALWAGNTGAAERILAYLPPTRRPVVEARIAFQRRSPDAPARMAAADPVGVTDGGYLADKSNWLRANGDGLGARSVLANRMVLTTPVGTPERWYETLLSNARGAAADGHWSVAYAIASKVDDALPAGADVSEQPIGVRDDYTSLTWLAGTAALNRLGRPADAIGMFTRYGGGARSPQTISKGFYWAGRAAHAAGRTREAQDYFRRASTHGDQYYGQLALERLGLPVPAPSTAQNPVEISAATRATFANRSVVRAARHLGATGQWQDQSRLLRAIAANAATDQDQLLVADLSRSLARPDLGVMAGRRALSSGLSSYAVASFPSVTVPDEHSGNWTMIHAIARQESQFDRQIVSRAGARGLMQLMPGTAREVAGKLGLGYELSSLNDPHYNIRLGSTYFRQMLNYYGGSYPLAVAAYNAGPGNVNKWLAANGDPRLPGGDIVQWVENIPISETRNYVQRVLENAVIYDLINPRNGGSRVSAPLSRYLGKQKPG